MTILNCLPRNCIYCEYNTKWSWTLILVSHIHTTIDSPTFLILPGHTANSSEYNTKWSQTLILVSHIHTMIDSPTF